MTCFLNRQLEYLSARLSAQVLMCARYAGSRPAQHKKYADTAEIESLLAPLYQSQMTFTRAYANEPCPLYNVKAV